MMTAALIQDGDSRVQPGRDRQVTQRRAGGGVGVGQRERLSVSPWSVQASKEGPYKGLAAICPALCKEAL